MQIQSQPARQLQRGDVLHGSEGYVVDSVFIDKEYHHVTVRLVEDDGETYHDLELGYSSMLLIRVP